MHSVRRIAVCAAFVLLVPSAGHPAALDAQQPLETETARLPLARTLVAGYTFEYQTSPQGTERSVPFAVEYGVTNRLTLLVEPVFYTAIRPKRAVGATGPGDLEATVQYLALDESGAIPAIALAAEVKVPTATSRLIGTGKTDYTPYLIVSKRFGHLDAHANVGYSIMGQPVGVRVQNTLNLAFALEDHVSPRLDLVGEVLSTSAAAGGGGGESSVTAPEVAGAEQVGMLGARYGLTPRVWLSFGVTYDNTGAVLFRPGLTTELRF
jgi:hypothetical protein